MLPYPSRELWPEKIYSLPELAYPETFNAWYELLDANFALGRGSDPAMWARSPCTYTRDSDGFFHYRMPQRTTSSFAAASTSLRPK